MMMSPALSPAAAAIRLSEHCARPGPAEFKATSLSFRVTDAGSMKFESPKLRTVFG